MRLRLFPLICAGVLAPSLAIAQPIGIGSSPQGTLTYSLGAAVAKVLQEDAHIQARVQPSSGTTVMVPLVNSGELDLGNVNTLELTDAYEGKGTFDKRPQKNLRAIAVLFPLKSGFFVRKNSPIKSLKDIRGKSIAYGYTSQGIIKTIANGVLANAGLTVADMKTVLVPNIVRGVDEFVSGNVDLGYFAIGTAKVAEADASVGGIRFLPMETDPASIAAMKKIVPTAYIGTVQPAPNLPGIIGPTKLMFYDYVMFANASMSDKQAYEIAKTLSEQHGALAANLAQFKGMDVARMYRRLPVPYHPGALRYYKEHGVKETE